MGKINQQQDVVPPSPADLDQSLKDFSSGVQGSFSDLYQGAHSHDIISAAPSDQDGSPGDISLYDDGVNQYLYVRFQGGWKRFVPA